MKIRFKITKEKRKKKVSKAKDIQVSVFKFGAKAQQNVVERKG